MFEGLGGLGGMADVVVNMGLLFVGMLFVVGITGAIIYFYWFNYKRYQQYSCIIFEKDAFGNIHSSTDDGAIFVKGTNKRLWLRKNNISMPGDDLPYFMQGNKKALFILKKGTKNYVFIQPKIDDDDLEFMVGEEDVNWATIAFDHSTRNFGENWIMQMMPYAMVAFAMLVTMVIAIMIIKKFDVLLEVSKNLGGAISKAVV